MQRSLALALVVSLSARAFANECSAGYTYKADLTNLLCKSDATTAASCNDNCCTKDTNTCGGLGATCAAGKYAFSATATQAVQDAWSAKAATQKDMGTQCCTAVAKCSSAAFTCPAGSKKTTDAALTCTSDAASCATTAQCCVSNEKTCQGQKAGNKCGGGACACDAAAAAKTSAPAEGSDDAWKNTVTDGATLADFKEKCCTRALPTCESDSYQCPPGFERNTAEKARFCNGFDAASACAQTTAWGDVTIEGVKVGNNEAANGMCCKAVTRACKTLAVTCAADRYKPSSLDGVVAPADKELDVCCTAKATCSMVAACPSGYKKKANSDATLCTGDIASCTDATALAAKTCCEADTNKCGGLFDLSCKTGYFSERSQAAWNDAKIYTQARKDAWNNKPANETTKNDACCTKQAACSNTSTTTPAPVAATTTPAPALKYSAHQIATQREGNHTAMNIVWLAVGGVMGMAVLAVAHGLRSRTAVEDSREVDTLLADEMSSIE